MIKYWEEGYELISTQRKEEYENIFFLKLKKIFYNKILKKEKKISLTGDFRLISSKIKPYLSKNINKTIFLRSFISELDFKRKNLEYKRNSRIGEPLNLIY